MRIVENTPARLVLRNDTHRTRPFVLPFGFGLIGLALASQLLPASEDYVVFAVIAGVIGCLALAAIVKTEDMEAVFDRETGQVTVSRRNPLLRKEHETSVPLSTVSGVGTRHRVSKAAQSHGAGQR